jgi:hypothetical protein
MVDCWTGRIAALFVSVLIWNNAVLAGEFGVWGRVTPFSKGEVWATYGVLLKDYYTAAVTHTQDGNAVELGLAYELSRLVVHPGNWYAI